MRRTHRLRPALADQLEARLVLSQGIAIAPANVAPLNASGRVRALNVAAVQQINQAYDSFRQDYLSALGAYFNGDAASTQDDGASTVFFRRLVQRRIDLLSEQITQVFVQIPAATKRGNSGSPRGSMPLQSFLRTRVNGNNETSLLRNLVGTANATNVIPPSTSDDSVAALFTASSLNAIETARAATVNATASLLRGTFKK